ncbi:MAG: hypothetical protein BAJALOKI2v1_190002 [Promethearchaeota archaeon]|nr:MAG: hypothetical protein BAJALOKI2v1_190002 [Candidatus Lokiarchaeota archaeon]
MFEKLKKIILLILITLSSFPLFGGGYGGAVTLARYQGAKLEEKGGVRILSVEGDPYEMGYQHGYLVGKVYGERALHLWSLTITATAMLLGGGDFQTGLELMHITKSLMEPYIPQDLKIEMQGMADGLCDAYPQCPLTYDDILLLNTHEDATAASWWHHFNGLMNIMRPYELGTEYPELKLSSNDIQILKQIELPSCSSFSMWDKATKNKHLIAAGTEDWFEFSTSSFGGIGNILDGNIIFIANPDKGYAFGGTSAILLISCSQGWNEEGITACQKTSTSIYETLCGWGDFVQCRMLIQFSSSIEDAVDLLTGPHHRTRGLNWEITDAEARKAASIEISATEVAVRYGNTGDSIVSTNNYFCYPGFEGYEGHNMIEGQFLKWGYGWPYSQEEWLTIVSSDHRYFTYKSLIEDHYGTIDMDDAKEFLLHCTSIGEKNLMFENVEFYKTGKTGDLSKQSMSVQRFVAHLKTGKIEVSLGGSQPENLGPWISINLRKYF